MNTTQATSETFDQNARGHWPIRFFTARCEIWRTILSFDVASAIASVDDWEGLRERARAIKEETLLHLDKYLGAIHRKCRKGRGEDSLGT